MQARSLMMPTRLALACAVAVAAAGPGAARADSFERNFAGSIQLDYMAVPSESIGRKIGLDAATAEVSMKVTQDFGDNVSASIKLCVACHGIEAGMAFFDLRLADELNFRVGRFTPQFGSFPIRYDPANHRTSDKPLPYDMGRMLRFTEWNMGVLPSPWVDNGIELSGAHYFTDDIRLDYAAYAVGGPRAQTGAADFDYRLSRSGEAYYVDNNSRPSIGGNIALNVVSGQTTITAGASAMAGTYDPQNKLHYQIAGAHLIL